ncbi:Mediator of RNA polymerase II transcription subunit 12 [Homalodisca vitripennis]|nr:Mediator of RNA polymerase II transcription subunit 12 [Homalodisca vitripennis]
MNEKKCCSNSVYNKLSCGRHLLVAAHNNIPVVPVLATLFNLYLSCHVSGTSPHPVLSNSVYNIKLSCDRHLLVAAHNNIPVVPVLATLFNLYLSFHVSGTSPHPVLSNSVYNIKLSCDRHLLVAAHNNIPVVPVLATLFNLYLSCHVSGTSPHPVPSNSVYNIKLSCDRHLLAAAHNNIQVGPVLAVLKAILVVGDATAKRTTGSLSKKSDSQSGGVVGGVKSELSISHILGTSDMGGELLMDLAASGGVDGTAHSLSDLAQLVLREICSQEWVLERCLQNPEELCTQDMLLDSMLSPKQAQRLLHMICYPDSDAHSEINLDHKSIIVNILENLDLWTLRMSWLDMQLMYKQLASGSQELNQWLDTVAKAAIDVFQLTAMALKTLKMLNALDTLAHKQPMKTGKKWKE